MRGRKPELKAISGGMAQVPSPPDWLPDEAKVEWRRVMPDLVKRRVVVDAQLATVEHYCLAVAIVRECRQALEHEGCILGGKRHPALQSLFQALGESRRLAAELGLTPASRAKVGSDDTGDDDELAGMVA